jgi:hypothetical protein
MTMNAGEATVPVASDIIDAGPRAIATEVEALWDTVIGVVHIHDLLRLGVV